MCTPGGGTVTAKGNEKMAPKNLGGIPSANAKVLFLPTTIPPPRVNGPGHVSSFERGGPLARGAMFLLSKGGVHGHAHGGSIDSSSRKKSKKILCVCIF